MTTYGVVVLFHLWRGTGVYRPGPTDWHATRRGHGWSAVAVGPVEIVQKHTAEA